MRTPGRVSARAIVVSCAALLCAALSTGLPAPARAEASRDYDPGPALKKIEAPLLESPER